MGILVYKEREFDISAWSGKVGVIWPQILIIFSRILRNCDFEFAEVTLDHYNTLINLKCRTINSLAHNHTPHAQTSPFRLSLLATRTLHLIYNNMINQLQAIQEALRLWRGVVLTLTVVMLFISLLADDDMVIIVLIICFFALILFQLRNLPSTSYQLFILLLLAYFIFICGKFLEGFYDRTEVTFAYVSKNIYNMFVIAVFIVVLWRHYQKESLINRLEFDDNANVF